MPNAGVTNPDPPRPSVFLSYASEDREAARLLKDALPAFGLEVWYDESDLGGGELWDQKIRRQIRECDYFMPLVSAQTEGRHEGYFRREWRLAVERTLDMADDHPFLLPIVIDGTDQAGARVPEKFMTVQWLRVPGGRPTAALEALCRRIAAGDAVDSRAVRKEPTRAAQSAMAAPRSGYPEFPREEPGQRIRFFVHVIGWAVRSAWIFYGRWPRWVRISAAVWLCVVLLSRGCSTTGHHLVHERPPPVRDMSPAVAEKLKAIAAQYQGTNNADVAKLGTQIAHEFSQDADEEAGGSSPLLAIPFTAAAGDAAAERFADSTFALVYGRIAMSRHGQVNLPKDPLPAHDLAAALERGRAGHATYILRGTIESRESAQVLNVQIAKVADGSIVWSKVYPTAGADPLRIAAEVNSHVPSLDGE